MVSEEVSAVEMERTVNVSQAKDMINCSRSYVYQLIERGELRALRIGQRQGIRVFVSSIQTFMADKRDGFDA